MLLPRLIKGRVPEPRNFLMLLSLNNPSILLKGTHSPYFSYQKLCLPVCELYVNRIKQYVFYCVQFVFLSVITVRLIHVVGFNYTFIIFIIIRHSIVQVWIVHRSISVQSILVHQFSYFTGMDICVTFTSELLYELLLWSFSLSIFYAHVSTFLLDVYLRVKWPGHRALKFNLRGFQMVFVSVL